LLRDNIVWRSGDAALLGIHTLRDWRAQWKDERLARKLDSEPGDSQASEAGAAGLEYAPPPAEAGGWHLNPMVVTAR